MLHHTTFSSFGAAALLALTLTLAVQDAQPAFERTTIDLGVVVGDIEASAAFYGETLGFEERDGFDVPAGFCADAGLTDDKPLSIRVFTSGAGDAATKLKLMQVEDTRPVRADNAFIHSSLGFSYLTIYVEDLDVVLTRLARKKVEVLGKGPVSIGEGEGAPRLALVRDPDGNFVELIGR